MQPWRLRLDRKKCVTVEPTFCIFAPVRSCRAATNEDRHPLAGVNLEAEGNLDAELLARIAKGDRQALGSFYDRHSSLLYSLILRILNDAAEAEDVLQDVFLQIWNKAAAFDPALGKPLSWTVALTRNKALDRLRSFQRRLAALSKTEEAPSPAAATQADEFYRHEISSAVQEALCKLPSDQRQAIELAYFGGLTQTEISEQLQAPLGTVKARIRRGMLRLRDLLKAHL